MTSSPDNTVEVEAFSHGRRVTIKVDPIMTTLYKLRPRLPDEQPLTRVKKVKKAKQSLDSHYLSIFLELVGEPEKGMESKITKTPNGLVIDEWGDIASGFRNALRQELRTALQDRLGEKS